VSNSRASRDQMPPLCIRYHIETEEHGGVVLVAEHVDQTHTALGSESDQMPHTATHGAKESAPTSSRLLKKLTHAADVTYMTFVFVRDLSVYSSGTRPPSNSWRRKPGKTRQYAPKRKSNNRWLLSRPIRASPWVMLSAAVVTLTSLACVLIIGKATKKS
jgi:hypothetical protein